MRSCAFKSISNTRLAARLSLSHGVNRLTNVASVFTPNSTTLNSSAYGYNLSNQRTNQVREDGAHWVYPVRYTDDESDTVIDP